MGASLQSTSDRERLRNYLVERAEEGGFFFKSKFIADEVELSASQVGILVSQLRDRENDLAIEPWSYTNATTWRVEPDSD